MYLKTVSNDMRRSSKPYALNPNCLRFAMHRVWEAKGSELKLCVLGFRLSIKQTTRQNTPGSFVPTLNIWSKLLQMDLIGVVCDPY